MSSLSQQLKRSGLPVLLVLCLAALSVSYASADQAQRPMAVQVIGDPDAAVTGRLAVGTATPGSKALTVVGVIDFLGAGTVHNYFTQGGGNNMQINANVDEANVVGDASRSQWKLVLGSSLDWFSIRRSPAGGTYNEDALFFIEGSTGRVGIATVDTSNGAAIPFTPQARLDVRTASGDGIRGESTDAAASAGVYGLASSTGGRGVVGYASAASGATAGVLGRSDSTGGMGVYGYTTPTTGANYGVWGQSDSTSGFGVVGTARATTGGTFGVYGDSFAASGYGVYGRAWATTGTNYGVYGQAASTSGRGVYGVANATTGDTEGVHGQAYSPSGWGVYGLASSTTGSNRGVYGRSDSPDGYGVVGNAAATTGTNYGVYGWSSSSSGIGVGGDSTAYIGVWGDGGYVGVWGDGGYYGVRGQSDSTYGFGVYGEATANSGTNAGVYGGTNSPSGYGVYFYGGLAGYGTKSAIVETQDYGWRTLYTIESPQNWFEDFGLGTLASGEAVVSIEPIFAQTVNLSQPYHVFLTPRGGFCGLYVAETSPTAFTVRAVEGAGCEIAFDYRIVAPRLGYEDLRLEPAADPEAVAASLPAAE